MKNFLTRLTAHRSVFTAISALPDFGKNAIDLVISSLMINLFALAFPIMILQLYDRIIPYQAKGSLMWLGIGCLIAIILESLLRQIRSLISSWWASQFEYLTGCEVVRKILTSQLTDFEDSDVGVHLDRINSISTLRAVFAGPVFQVLLDLPFAVIYLWCIWLLGGSLVNIPLTIIAVFFVITMICRLGFTRARRSQISGDEKRYGFFIEILNGIQTIKSIGMEEMVLRHSEALHADNSRSENRLYFWNKLPGVIGLVLSRAAMFGIILLGARMVIQGDFTLGTLAACTMLVRRAMQPFIQVAGCWLQLSDAQLALHKLQEINSMQSDYNSELPMLPDTIDGSIDIKELFFKTRPDLPYILENINLSVSAKQFVCISGENNHDTSLLLSLILGATQPEKGAVFIDNYKLSAWNLSDFQGRLEYLPPQGTLFKGSLLDNITMFDPGKQSIALDTAALLNLDRLVAQLPAGFQTQVTSLSNELFPSSLIQRISIARTLVVRPRILLLDRTNQSMDRDTEKMFDWLLKHLKGKATILFVTNDIKYLTKADAIYQLENGHLEKSIL